MHVPHTPGPWWLVASTEDYQGHFVVSAGRTVAATTTVDSCDVTSEEQANACLIAMAPALFNTLRQIISQTQFRPEERSMDLGQRLLDIEQAARDVIARYETLRSTTRANEVEEAARPDSNGVEANLLHERILREVSAGPWRPGLHLPGFSADSEPCIYGDERDLPLVRFDADDGEASANAILMAGSWELCRELGEFLKTADRSRRLLSRIHRHLMSAAAERYGQEENDE